MSDEPVLKRRRIAAACNSCRSKKSKCDGKRPTCGRCAGYGFHCRWRNQPQSLDSPSSGLAASATTAGTPLERSQELFAVYQQLVQSLIPQLAGDVRVEVRNCLAMVQARVDSLTTSEVDTSSPNSASTSSVRLIHSQKYLGEISDVHFCNAIKQKAEPEVDSRDATDSVDNYDREEHATPRHISYPLLDLPERAQVEEYLQTYFTTIHCAYPFVRKPAFMEKLETLHTQGVTSSLTPSWLSLLYALLALGAYYNSFRDSDTRDGHSHQTLFQKALNWSENDMLERSLTQTSALLAQCFYFLATSQLDRCWISLGLAIRLGQSIGLHADMGEPSLTRAGAQNENNCAESRGRVWYCLYVLDRLLALQLGRPPAISDEDCHAPIPHPLTELDLDSQEGKDPSTNNEGDSRRSSDYFASTIKFSSVIGRVLRETYHPQRQFQASLRSTSSCDKQLLEWKMGLPRHLRFDLGHVFDKSPIFKRQRNMLAIKFHHIRILIHRPYLCYPHLNRQKNQVLLPDQQAQVQDYGNTCVQEAQSIAHLMHNVSDTIEIVLNYPWWQMVSCLVAAGSVLVLGDSFTKKEPPRDLNVGTSGLSDDAETCMRVLHALSSNSDGAKLAHSMLRGLRARSARIPINTSLDSSHTGLPDANLLASDGGDSRPQDSQKAYSYCNDLMNPAPGLAGNQGEDAGLDTNIDDRVLWPMMIPDWMNWSTEYLETFQAPDHSAQRFHDV